MPSLKMITQLTISTTAFFQKRKEKELMILYSRESKKR